jgi:hypothetical protein
MCDPNSPRSIFLRLTVVVIFVLAGVASTYGQPPEQKTSKSERHLRWHKYVNREYGISFWYPDVYVDVPRDVAGERCTDTDYRKCLVWLARRDNPDVGIWMTISVEPFRISEFSNGMPSRRLIGRNVFYSGLAGSMGVGFSDRYDMNLRGKTLMIIFGPDDNSGTSEETQELEPKILRSLQTQQPQSRPASTRKRRSEKPIVYENDQYGFTFTLPASWRGYSVIEDSWSGSVYGPMAGEAGEQGGTEPKSTIEGPELTIRHPLWTEAKERQDIPIMIVTFAQWRVVQTDEVVFGAAPVGPREIGRNTHYVFATPPRYNYALTTGYEEVEALIQSHSLLAREK